MLHIEKVFIRFLLPKINTTGYVSFKGQDYDTVLHKIILKYGKVLFPGVICNFHFIYLSCPCFYALML